MAITIKRGSTDEARREFICFVHAFQCMGLNDLDDATVTLTPRTTTPSPYSRPWSTTPSPT